MNNFAKIALAGILAGAAATAFAANGDGYKMSVCSNDKSKLCYDGKEIFLNGMNIAWWNFGQDVGINGKGAKNILDENSVRKDLKDLRAAGGNSIRWWLYTNNSMDPSFDATTKYATKIEDNTISNVGMVLDIAEEYGILVDLCFLSFDMAKKTYEQDQSWGSRYEFAPNEKILLDTAATRAYIDVAVLPLVKKYKDHPALLAWEVFNEPEGMTSTDNFGNGWGTELFDIKYIQRVINMFADAIHKEAPNNLVTNGSARFSMTSDVNGTNYYTDAKLLASGDGNYTKGNLDFYQVHYYPEWNMNNQSPFHNPYSYFKLDKPMVVGELPGADWDNITSGGNLSSDPSGSRQMKIADAYKYAFENGYSGALGWTLHEEKAGSFYDVTWSLAASSAALTTIYNLDSTKVKLKDAAASAGGQNGWMKVTYTNTDGSKGANLGYSYVKDMTGVTKITYTVKNLSSQEADLTMAIKTGNDDGWKWYNGNTNCLVAAGETATCEFPLSKFAYWEDNAPLGAKAAYVAEVIIKFNGDGFSGEVLFDDVVAEGLGVINNFDTEFDTFKPDAESNDYIAKVETYFDGTPANTEATNGKATTAVTKFSVTGTNIMLSSAVAGNVSVEVFSMTGKHIATLFRGNLSAGTHAFSLSDMAKGQYIVRVKGAGIAATKVVAIP